MSFFIPFLYYTKDTISEISGTCFTYLWFSTWFPSFLKKYKHFYIYRAFGLSQDTLLPSLNIHESGFHFLRVVEYCLKNINGYHIFRYPRVAGRIIRALQKDRDPFRGSLWRETLGDLLDFLATNLWSTWKTRTLIFNIWKKFTAERFSRMSLRN